MVAARSGTGGRDYTRYDLTIDELRQTGMSKQAAVKTAIQQLHQAGVGLDEIKSVTQPNRWVAVHPAAAETIEEAFEREHPDRSPRGLWFDFGISDDDATWIIPRYGGRHTEHMLDGPRRSGPTTHRFEVGT